MLSLATIVFLGELLVSQKLGVHAFCTHELATLSLLNAVGMGFARIVMRASVLLLLE
jgi:hypothetical protein